MSRRSRTSSSSSASDSSSGAEWEPEADPFGDNANVFESDPFANQQSQMQSNPVYTPRGPPPTPPPRTSSPSRHGSSSNLQRPRGPPPPPPPRNTSSSRQGSSSNLQRPRGPPPPPPPRSVSLQRKSSSNSSLGSERQHSRDEPPAPPPKPSREAPPPKPSRVAKSGSGWKSYTPSPPPQMYQFDERSGARPKDRSTRHRFDTPSSGGVWPNNFQIEKITDQHRLDRVKDGQMVIVVFYSNDSLPCRMHCRKIESLAETRPKAKFVRVNVDENAAIVDECAGLRDDFGIHRDNLPFAVSYVDGSLYQTFHGPNMTFELDSLLDQTVPMPGSQKGSTAGQTRTSPRWSNSP